MKRILFIAIALLLIAQTGAFAAASFNGSSAGVAAVTTVIGGGIYAPSSGVTVKVNSIATSYCAASAHASGTRQWATCGGTGVTTPTDNTSKIYFLDATGSSSLPDPGSTSVTGAWQ